MPFNVTLTSLCCSIHLQLQMLEHRPEKHTVRNPRNCEPPPCKTCITSIFNDVDMLLVPWWRKSRQRKLLIYLLFQWERSYLKSMNFCHSQSSYCWSLGDNQEINNKACCLDSAEDQTLLQHAECSVAAGSDLKCIVLNKEVSSGDLTLLL